MDKKVFFIFYILAFLANTIPVFFNKYIMSNMTTTEYIKYQALWTIVLWFQPATSLGSQNNIRVLGDHEITHKYVANTLIISFIIITFGLLFNVDFFSMICALLVTIVSYSITYLESSQKFIKSSIFKFVWLFFCGIGTVIFVKKFGFYSRILSTSIISLIFLIYFRKILFNIKSISFNKNLFTTYGVGLSILVVSINLIFYSDRLVLERSYSDFYQYQFACGYFLMNMIIFSSRPLVLLSEVGIKSSKIWDIKKSFYAFAFSIIIGLFIYLFRDLIIDFFFYSNNLTLTNKTIIIWLIIGVLRLYSDLLIPLINKKKNLLFIISLFLILGYYITVKIDFLSIPYFYILFFFSLIVIILYDFYFKQRTA